MFNRFFVGEIVSLKHGWTPLQVTEVLDTGEVRAVYCHRFHVTQDYFDHPHISNHSNSKLRWADQFEHWNEEIPPYANQTMYRMALELAQQKQYDQRIAQMIGKHFIRRSVVGSVNNNLIGKCLATTSENNIVLEMTNKEVLVFHPDELREYHCPRIYVKSVKPNSSYTATYEVPHNHTIRPGDSLLSDSGNIYEVLDIDIDGGAKNMNKNYRGTFHGKKLITEDLV